MAVWSALSGHFARVRPITGLRTREKEEDPAERQSALMRHYHEQGLAQAKISFWFGLVFASLGFIVILVALLPRDHSQELTDQGSTFMSIVAGAIIEAVSSLFLVQSNRARRLMVKFFDKLRTDRKLDEALALAERISEGEVQSRLKALLALIFAGANVSDTVISQLLSSTHAEDSEGGDKGAPTCAST